MRHHPRRLEVDPPELYRVRRPRHPVSSHQVHRPRSSSPSPSSRRHDLGVVGRVVAAAAAAAHQGRHGRALLRQRLLRVLGNIESNVSLN